jgi:hypothetical protein
MTTPDHGPVWIDVYETRSKNPTQRFAWRAISSGNGRKVAQGEGYVRPEAAADMATYLIPHATHVEILGVTR